MTALRVRNAPTLIHRAAFDTLTALPSSPKSESLIPAPVLKAYGLGRARVAPVETGWINRTFVVGEGAARRVLQRLNPMFGKEIHEDAAAITAHLADQGLLTPLLLPAQSGALFVECEGVWRAWSYVEGRTFDTLGEPQRVRSAARLTARFHNALLGVKHAFRFVRPHAHDTAQHLRRLSQTLADYAGHQDYDALAPLVEAVLDRGHACRVDFGDTLPHRIIHGDLKATNIRFHPERPVAIALLDLDTLAEDTIAVELGDALRSWCNTRHEASEHASFSRELFLAAVQGYAEACRTPLSAAEQKAIVDGAETISCELAARFARDAFEARTFGWDPTRFESRLAHNLARVRAHIALVDSIRAQRAQLLEDVRRAFAAPGPGA